ncbi:hypothetical protein PSGK_14655 [Pseudomonas solani]|jgi:hypothetical protein|uniref:DUF6916 family protein n=1 Tax=Pseudomonas TaxID=286 RepID=UPI000DA8CF88|nr:MULTISPECIES: hypothetical protein [Pseudomonas]MDW3710571.1 hypothetical protein [Pseudomonas sp. 2023EL-01195]PZE14135.1 hypothetical protein DMX10_07710 [Pseudomonas sp. 57B-090624]
MHPMPSFALLTEIVGQPFHLWLSPEQVLPIELLAVEEGTAMTPRHQCYLAHFALPSQCSLPQDVYRLGLPGEPGWELLLTPAMPAPDGRPVLQAVFHTDRPA